MRDVPRAVRARATDEIRTTCSYDTTSATSTTYGGEASYNEMCYGFLFFYPRLLYGNGVDVTSCNA